MVFQPTDHRLRHRLAAGTRDEEPACWNALENLCISRGLKMPTLRLIETEGMNAFASACTRVAQRHRHAAACWQNLDPDELEAVLGARN